MPNVKVKRLKTAELKTFGTAPRHYDALTDDDDANETELARVMMWVTDDYQNKSREGADRYEKLGDFILTSVVGVENLNPLDANQIMGQVGSNLKPVIVEKSRKTFTKLKFDAKDFFIGTRRKSAVTTILAASAGLAIGAVIGAIVVPGIGGPVGAAIGTFVGGIGGPITLAAIGGVMGRWFGHKVSKKVFKDEKHYQLSTKKTHILKNAYGINARTATMMNAYMYNRAKALKSEKCKQYYKMICKQAIKGNSEAMNSMVQFFCHELVLLQRELNKNKESAALQKDMQTVEKILNSLAKSTLPLKQKQYIQKLLKSLKAQGLKAELNQIADVGVEQSKSLNHPKPIASHMKKEASVLKPPVLKTPPKIVVKNEDPKVKRTAVAVSIENTHIQALQELVHNNQVPRAFLEHYQNELAEIAQKMGNDNILIATQKHDDVASVLMAAALKANLKPILDESNYPLQEELRRRNITKNAYEMAGMEMPRKKKPPTPSYGLPK